LQVSLRDATVLHSTGGLFSVALSVNRTARMTCAAAPLTLSGALPIGSRPCDRKPRCPDFPPVLALRLGPAITRLTRYTNYSAGICVGIRNHFFARLGLNGGFYSVSRMRRQFLWCLVYRPIPEKRVSQQRQQTDVYQSWPKKLSVALENAMTLFAPWASMA